MTLDKFTRSYLEAALFTECFPPRGNCPRCGAENCILPCRVRMWRESPDWVCLKCGGGKESDDSFPPADDYYGIDDFHPDDLARIAAECEKFQAEFGHLAAIENRRYSGHDPDELAGHDFWLTRNGHGAGFWDGDWNEPAASALEAAAKRAGEQSLYLGDDGKIHVYPPDMGGSNT